MLRLTAGCCVAGRLNLLTYWPVCCAVSATGALPAAVIRSIKGGFTSRAAHPKRQPATGIP